MKQRASLDRTTVTIILISFFFFFFFKLVNISAMVVRVGLCYL